MLSWTQNLKSVVTDRKLEHTRVRIKQVENTKECYFYTFND
jgi:hypothetical protein